MNASASGTPELLRFEKGYFRSYSCQVQWRSNDPVLLYTMRQFEYQNRKTSEPIEPNQADWAQFRRTLESLKVWDWKEDYYTAACDGGGYSLVIEWGGKNLTSRGSNRYPPGFRDFTDSLSKLCGDRIIGQPYSRILPARVEQARREAILRLALRGLARKPRSR